MPGWIAQAPPSRWGSAHSRAARVARGAGSVGPGLQGSTGRRRAGPGGASTEDAEPPGSRQPGTPGKVTGGCLPNRVCSAPPSRDWGWTVGPGMGIGENLSRKVIQVGRKGSPQAGALGTQTGRTDGGRAGTEPRGRWSGSRKTLAPRLPEQP